MSAIARLMPRPRLREVDRVAVAASPEEAWRVVREIDLYELGFVRALFCLRTGGKTEATARIDDIVAPGKGFHLLAETPGREVVAGAIGKFWRPSIPFVDTSPETFSHFAETGYGKVAWSLEVAPRAGGGSWVIVDLRVDATDDASWHDFVPYWIAIGRFSRAIRKGLLARVVRKLGRGKRDAYRALPGDELLPHARVVRTDAVTIEAPASCVWPWLVQMGCRRAGWYSLDCLDNAGVPSANRILPELQHIAVGDRIPATPKGEDGFAVLAVDPERSLILGSPRLSTPARAGAHEHGGIFGADYDMTWSFVLEPIGEDATHLVARVRGDFEPSIGMSLLGPGLVAGHEVMEHVQLRNLKRRAEALVTR